MQFKIILKSLLLTYLCSSAYAAPSKDDCKELKEYLTNAKASSIEKCKVNSKGELSELKFEKGENLTNEDFKKVFSYSTIKKLDYDEEYSDCAALNNGISNLKNLEELNIRSFRGKIAPNVLKDLKSLKSFSYDAGDYNYGDLTQDNINELSNLSNLRELKLKYVEVDEELNFSPLKNSKISSLTLETNGKAGINLRGLVKNLKNLKELKIISFVPSQKEIDAITSSNIEKLTIKLDKDTKTDDFKKLKSLKSLDLTMKDTKEVPEFVNTIPELKKAKFNGKDVPLNNNAAVDQNTLDTYHPEVLTNSAINGTLANGNSTVATNPNTPINNPEVATSDAKTVFIQAFTYLPLLALYFVF